MNIEEFAKAILLGTSLEDKLINFDFGFEQEFETISTPELSLSDIPNFPGRPIELRNPSKATFPSLARLHEPTVRGEVLHFFANHELLAMELMALVLLRFPKASSEFRKSILKTISEEQSHLRLYITRMKELGVSFGDLPVSDYFWKTMKQMESPLDYTVQMSLTFEQANLDFSFFYMNEVKKIGDDVTAKLLERVFLEEIGHVKNGLTWFNRLRESFKTESEWDAYNRLLPAPLTPQRAKGFEFNFESRRKAGFSENFINELSVYSSSKGRPPTVWFYNPHCDSEIARGKIGFTPTSGAREVSKDLETLPMFLGLAQDVVLVQEKPRTEWLSSVQSAGFEIPEFSTFPIRAPKIAGLQPWGWSPDTYELFKPFHSKLVGASGSNSNWCNRFFSRASFEETQIGSIFSKAWSSNFLRNWIKNHPDSEDFFGSTENIGSSFSDWESARSQIEIYLPHAMVKAPYGTSGMQVRKAITASELEGPLGGWIKNIIETQGSIVVEPYLDKLTDLSIQMEIREDRTITNDPRRFLVGNRNEYRGTFLGKLASSLSQEEAQFIQSALKPWQQLLRDLAINLREHGYEGPAGIDAFIWRQKNGSLKLKPLVELNPRWTMGRVALEIERHLAPGVRGMWNLISMKEILKEGYSSALEFSEMTLRNHPLKMTAKRRIVSGVLFTTDPKRAREVLTVLSVPALRKNSGDAW